MITQGLGSFLDPGLKRRDITIPLQVISFIMSANEIVCKRTENRLEQLRVIAKSDFIEMFMKSDPKDLVHTS
jgi:hypothetical protein